MGKASFVLLTLSLLSSSAVLAGDSLVAAAVDPAGADEKALKRQVWGSLRTMTDAAQRNGFRFEAHTLEVISRDGSITDYYTLEAGSRYAFGGVCDDGCHMSLRVFNEHKRLVAEGPIGSRPFVVLTAKETGPYLIRLDMLGSSTPRCGAALGFYFYKLSARR